ncbi:MAG: DUF2283 domain-containing protein [Chloroflexi bacterium]|nr:DUF2283 domain-containing protein [Chloroflexota bacterium]
MKYEYDREADALYIWLSDKPYAYGEDLDRERRIDYASDGTPVGVELLCVSSGVSLHDLPQQDKIAQVLRELRIKVLV